MEENKSNCPQFSVFHRTMDALEKGLTCKLISSIIDLDATALDIHATDEQILQLALDKRFSRIPLWSTNKDSHKEILDIAFVKLKQKCITERRKIATGDLIAGDTPIETVIGLINRKHFFLVLSHDSVTGIITRADLNKLPVRTYAATLLFHLEGLLADTIEQIHAGDSWLKLLSGDRIPIIKDLHEEKKANDLETRLIDCTTLIDKCKIARKSECLRKLLENPSTDDIKHQIEIIKELRNCICHSSPKIQLDIAKLHEAITLIRAWIHCISKFPSPPIPPRLKIYFPS